MSTRGVFFDREVAVVVVARLRRNGYAAEVVRTRFAGEDDDTDHAWTVTSDAPEAMLELLVEENDGWMEHDAPPGPGPSGLRLPPAPPLPDAPRRRHRDDPHVEDGNDPPAP